MSFIDNGNGNGFYMPVSPAYGSNNGDISDFERKRIMDEIQRLREMKD